MRAPAPSTQGRIGPLGAAVWSLAFAALFGMVAHLDHAAPPLTALVLPREAPRNVLADREQRREQPPARSTILDMQSFRSAETASGHGGGAALVNLNPNSNAWFLLTLTGSAGRGVYHLENPDPAGQHIHLAEGKTGPVITTATQTADCDLWSGAPSALQRAAASALPYAPLCEGRLYLRNRAAGHFSDLERVTEFLRLNVWNGDDIVGFVRANFYQDAFRDTGTSAAAAEPAASAGGDAPPNAAITAAAAMQSVSAPNFAIDVEGAPSRHLALGRWYPVRYLPGVYAGMMRPQAVSDDIVKASDGAVNKLDAVEGPALVDLTAFDLSQFELSFSLGTDNPRLGWSFIDKHGGGPGPDGIDSAVPLVTNGMVSPAVLRRVVATFAGGFKREQGAFRSGDLAHVHQGSHYGFIEQGVVFSKLQPDLATLYVLDDGSVHMETWSETNNSLLPHVRFARQNGVPLIERNASGTSVPGALVKYWGAGNWSSSGDLQLRTLRAGACIVEAGGKQYLLHAVFSTATPSAMALVFQAYGCRYAMLLDMNALEHSYLALYARHGDRLAIEHPMHGMTDSDRSSGNDLVPRFLGFPDNRDFFCLVRRKRSP